jgi:hypothetical protein
MVTRESPARFSAAAPIAKEGKPLKPNQQLSSLIDALTGQVAALRWQRDKPFTKPTWSAGLHPLSRANQPRTARGPQDRR